MNKERTIEERVVDIAVRYGHDWDRDVKAYIEGEFRMAVAQVATPMSGDLLALAIAAVDMRFALLSPTLNVEKLCCAKAALGEALDRPGIADLLKMLAEPQS